MKKLLIFLIFCFQLNFAQRQFFKGIGIFGALTQSCHNYTNSDQDKRDYDTTNFFANSLSTAYYPRNHTSNEYFSWGAGIFAEFSTGDRVRWQTEFEYVKKGAKEKELTDGPFYFLGSRTSDFSVNQYTYIQWNNYLKFYYPIGRRAHWYIMPGIRLEYNLSSSVSAFTQYAGDFSKFWFSGNLGIGYEFPITKRFSGIVEYHWNPDIIAHRWDNIRIRNRTFETRLGIVYRPRQKRIDDCNAPRYNGPAY